MLGLGYEDTFQALGEKVSKKISGQPTEKIRGNNIYTS